MNIQNNAHEMKIKLICARWLEHRYGAAVGGILINEFSANRSKARADLAYVSPSEIVAIEIKSNNDKTTRLEKQVKVLKQIYNRVEVITAKKHYVTAKTICAKENVGLHLVEGDELITIFRGRHRKIATSILANFAFPLSIKKRADFTATEEYYRTFLLKKYRNLEEDFEKHKELEYINELYIRSLNPHHAKRAQAAQKRIDYKTDLEALFRGLQSTHSSSNSSVDTSTP